VCLKTPSIRKIYHPGIDTVANVVLFSVASILFVVVHCFNSCTLPDTITKLPQHHATVVVRNSVLRHAGGIQSR